MDSGNDGCALGTTTGSDCCCWHDMLDQNHQERYCFKNCRIIIITQLTADQRKERKKEIILEEKGCVMYDEVKPNCAETAISLKSNIAYTTVKHTSVL